MGNMPLHFKPELRGCINIPASKSISNRVLFINALSKSPCAVENLAKCDDTEAMLRVVEAKDASAPIRQTATSRNTRKKVTMGMNDLFAQPTEEVTEPTATDEIRIDIGAAGSAMRFATALLATREGRKYLLSGSARMHQRPIGVLVDALRSLGADIAYVGEEGYPPLRITGRKLEGTTVELAADVSSQYISALLMIGPMLPQGLQLRLRGEIISQPYINLTIHLMREFGAKAMWIGDSTIYVHAGGYHRSQPFVVESDWSAASYAYELVALSSDKEARVLLRGLCRESMQGDSRVAAFFENLGVKTTFTDEGVMLTKRPLKEDLILNLDLSEQPDLAQTLVVTCAMMHVPFHFTGLQSLRIKETDRLSALQQELKKLGVSLQIRQDSEILCDGYRAPQPTSLSIDTYDDHRMAMAFAPCAMIYPGLTINAPEVVAKSFPKFWDTLAPFLLS